LTSLVDKSSGYMDNPLRQNFFRAGHAHAGVIVILSLVCHGYAAGWGDRADLHGSGGAGGGGADVRGGIAEECWLGVPRLKPLLEKFLDYRSGEPLRHPKAEGIRSHP
jgi:hypothetical protein